MTLKQVRLITKLKEHIKQVIKHIVLIMVQVHIRLVEHMII